MIRTAINRLATAFILALALAASGCQSDPEAPAAETAETETAEKSHTMTDTRLLAPCPSSPNCVSSLADDERHRGAPLPGAGHREASLALLKDTLGELPRVRFEAVGPARLQARFTTRVMRFVDDVTFYVHEDGVIEVRSASRLGYWDLGANRRRVEDLRERLSRRLEPEAGQEQAS